MGKFLKGLAKFTVGAAAVTLCAAGAYYDELISAETGTYLVIGAAVADYLGKMLKSKVALFVAVVVIYQLQAVHVDEGYEQL